MRYYLTGYVGTGSVRDPFRPAVADAAGDWSAIDLRVSPTSADGGMCLVATTADVTRLPAGGVDLGSSADSKLSVARSRALGNRLGVTIAAQALPDVVAELLIDHGRANGTRWRPLAAAKTGGGRRWRWEVHLGGLLWEKELPVIAGGAAVIDDFNRVDSTAIGAAWAEDLGDWSISGNALTNGLASDSEVRYVGTPMDTADQYAEVVVTGGGARSVAAMVRHPNSTVRTAYVAGVYDTTNRELSKRVNGSSTALAAAVTGTITLPGTVRVEAEAATIRGLWNGVAYATVTDTSIASGPHTGIFGYNLGATRKADSYAAGDLVEAKTTTAPLSSTGTLSAAGRASAAAPAVLSGEGTLTAGSSPAVEQDAAFSSTGTLTAFVGAAIGTTGGLASTGTLSAGNSPAITQAAAPGSTGTLSAGGTPAATQTAILSSIGTLAAGSTPAATQGATLSSTGSLTAGADPAVATAAAFGSTGTLTVGAAPSAAQAATLSSTGTLAATGGTAASLVAALFGEGTITAGASPGTARTAAFSAVGTLATVTAAEMSSAANLGAVGQLTAIATATGGGPDLPPLTGPVSGTFTTTGIGDAAYTATGLGVATFATQPDYAAAYTGTGAGHAAFAADGAGDAAYTTPGTGHAAFAADGIGAATYAH